MLDKNSGNSMRVFVSSSFRDMHAVREELVKRIFPQIRRMCNERGVHFSEVDLRWGILEEDSSEERILPICLAEIERCNVFLGILGARYGWIPELTDSLLGQFPWLGDHAGASITELEMQCGGLSPQSKNLASFFYLQSNGGLPNNESEQHQQRLISLRKRILSSERPVRQGWTIHTDLGQMVLADLRRFVDENYPANRRHEPEEIDQEACAYRKTGFYIPNAETLEKLDRHAEADTNESGMVITGQSGSGKSALIANWASRYARRHPDQFLFLHFVGASSQSSDWATICRRIIRKIVEHFDLEMSIPERPEQLREALDQALHHAAQRERLVLVLDALNQLEDLDAAPDLVWLPRPLPDGTRWIASTLDGPALDSLRQRNWRELKLESLDVETRRRFITVYLRRYGKALGENQISRISKNSCTENPLFLRSLLDEIRVFGFHEQVDQRIDHYLGAHDLEDLFSRILGRYEKDYETRRPALVRDAMTLLASSRNGLSESELLDLLSSNQQTIPRIEWSTFFLASDNFYINRCGLLDFAHDFLRQAVGKRYLNDNRAKAISHQQLATYFKNSDDVDRRIDEYPWHLLQTNDWARLNSFLADPNVVLIMRNLKKDHQLLKYWHAIEPHHSPATSYESSLSQIESQISDPESLIETMNAVAGFLFDFDIDQVVAEKIYRRVLAVAERNYGHESMDVSHALNQVATSLIMQEREAEAEPLLKRTLSIREQLLPAGHPDIADTYSNLAAIVWGKDGDVEEAIRYYKKALPIYQEALGPRHKKTILCIENLGQAHLEKEDLDSAKRYFEESLEMRKSVFGPRHYRTVNSYHGLGEILLRLGKHEDALSLLQKAYSIRVPLMGITHDLTRSLFTNLVDAMLVLGHLEEAEALVEKTVAEFNETGTPLDIRHARLLTSIGLEFYFRDHFVQSERIYRRCQELFEQLDAIETPDGALFLNNFGMLLRATNRFTEAAELIGKAREIFLRELGPDDPLVARTIHNLALTLFQQGETRAAEPLAGQALAERERILGPDHDDTKRTRQLLHEIGEQGGDKNRPR